MEGNNEIVKGSHFIFSILSIVSCSQAGFDQKSSDGNQAAAELKRALATPFPIR
jgi:hypothetical protein